MTDNRYAPPKAVVADPVIHVASASRPHEVILAARLLWFAVALGVLNFAVDSGPAVIAGSLPPAVFTGSAFAIGLTAWLTHNIARGRNWARVIFLVLAVLGLPVFLLQLPVLRDRGMLVMATSIAITVIQIVALYLVFIGAGAHWFRRDKNSSETVA